MQNIIFIFEYWCRCQCRCQCRYRCRHANVEISKWPTAFWFNCYPFLYTQPIYMKDVYAYRQMYVNVRLIIFVTASSKPNVFLCQNKTPRIWTIKLFILKQLKAKKSQIQSINPCFSQKLDVLLIQKSIIRTIEILQS